MDRRRESRLPVDASARVTLLGDVQHCFQGRVVNASGHGLRLLVGRSIAPGSPVRVEIGDSALLGEVCYSVPEGGVFAVGLELDQELAGLSALARHVDELLHRPPSALRRQD